MTDYLTLIEVLAIHDDQIKRYGGSDGIRDIGLLEAAIYRPQSGYYVDVIDQAAAMWESLAMNHPFVDGNKRIAIASTLTFLAINGYAITSDATHIYRFIITSLEAGEFDFKRMSAWLRHNTMFCGINDGDDK